MSSMDIGMRSWVAALSSFNASCIGENGNRVNVMDCGIDTQNISTLGEYLGKYDRSRIDNQDISRQIDNDKLMRTYVIPLTLPNGQQLDLVVNANGQDMACIYKDEEGKQASFELTPRMQREILSNGMRGIQGKIDPIEVKKALCPDTLEDFAREIEKDTLIPKTQEQTIEKIKARDNKADIRPVENENQVEQDRAKEEKGMSIPEASAVMGMEAEKLAVAVGVNAKILGFKFVDDVNGLENSLEKKFEGTASRAILVKVAGPGLAEQTYVLSYPDGQVLHSPERGNPKMLNDIVKTGENGGESITDMEIAIESYKPKSMEVETVDMITGKETKEYAEKGSESAVVAYSNESKQKMMEVNDLVRAILGGEGKESEKLAKAAELIYLTASQIDDLQSSYSVAEKETLESMRSLAASYSERSEIEKGKEMVVDVVETAVEAGVTLIKGKENKEVEQEEEQRVLGPAGRFVDPRR